MPPSVPVSPARRTRAAVLPVAAAIASFLIYAATIFALPQVPDSEYCCEHSSFAAAVSNIRYGSRIGSMYMGVTDLFMAHLAEPAPQMMKKVRAELPAQPPGKLYPTTLDGNGVGFPLIATVAFRLFGFHWWSPVAVMLILMAASMAVFLRRLPPLLVTLYFCGLTLMLFTPLVWDPAFRANIMIGGVRYFSLVGVLPLFHILLELLERQPSRATVPLVIQAAILTIAALTRGSAVTAFAAIAIFGLVFARRRPAAVRDLATVGVTSAALVIALALVVSPQWVKTGRFYTIVWTRVTESLGVNPSMSSDAALAELNRMFPCQKLLPEGITEGIGDSGAGCIWRAYVIKHNMPLDAVWEERNTTEYEAEMRRAFFQIAAKFPRETLQTFLYVKPLKIVHTIENSLRFKFSGDPPLSIALLLASLGIALVAAATASEINRETAVVLAAALFTTPAYIAAYSNMATSADLLLCCLVAAGLALSAIALCIRHYVTRLNGPAPIGLPRACAADFDAGAVGSENYELPTVKEP